MGNNELLPSNISVLKAQNWIQAGEDQENALFSNVNPYRRRLLANIISGELIEQYELNFITQEDYNSYILELSYRQISQKQKNSVSTQSYIYPIRYFVNKSKNEMCTTIHTGYLYADKVDLRLKEINDIPFQDLIYMYKATLTGFKALYQKVGYFDIVEEMIFISRAGQVRVWMNANLAKNYPNYERNNISKESNRDIENIYGSQADMIRKLISMIEKNSDHFLDDEEVNYTPQLFSQYLDEKNLLDKLSFQHCSEEFDMYLNQNNLHCPDFMRSIPELFSPGETHGKETHYDQSHVNQITSHHLTQIKRKFEPMEIIHQDQRDPSSMHSQPHFSNNHFSSNQLSSANQPTKFHESLVNMYTPQAFTTSKDPTLLHQFESDQRAVRPGHSPFTDLRQSRFSNQSNTHNEKRQKPTNPNSFSTLSYQQSMPLNQRNQEFSVHPQQQFRISHQNSLMPPPPQMMQQQILVNERGERVIFMSPGPDIRPMRNGQGVVHQNILPPKHPLMIPPPAQLFPQVPVKQNQSQMNFSTAANQKFENGMNPSPAIIANSNQNASSAIRKFQTSSSSMGSDMQNSSAKMQSSEGKLQSPFVEIRKQESQVQQKSKVKYFTTKDSYQLDEQIANDLEKFLGLKVN